MSGPWENYAPSAANNSGPWSKYASASAASNAQQYGPPTQYQQFMSSPMSGFVNGMVSGVVGMGQMVPRAISEVASLGGNYPNPVSRAADQSAAMEDQTQTALLNDRSRALKASGYKPSDTDWSQIVGNIASPANIPLTMAGGELPAATTLGGKVLQGMGMGAAYAAPAPVDTTKGSYASQKLGQEEVGAVTGGLAPVVGEMGGRLLSPQLSPEAKILQDEGINLTFGQRSGGWGKALEDKLTSIPVVGDVIKNAQGRSIDDLNTAVANRALNPIGESLPSNVPVGREAVQYVKDKLGQAYDSLLPKLSGDIERQTPGIVPAGVTPPASLDAELNNLKNMAANGLPAHENKVLNDTLQREVYSRVSPNGKVTGQSLKDMQSGLQKTADQFKGSQDAYQRQLYGALTEAKASIQRMIGRQNPGYAKDLNAIDEGYANYARMRTASGYQGAQNGVFTPAQLSAAVRAGDKTVGHGGFAIGNAYMQDLSDAAKNVLPSKYPDSGTAGRVLMAAMLGEKGLAMAIGGGIPAAAAYSRTASKMAETLSKRPEALQPVAQAVRQYSNPAALARALAGK